MSTTSREVHLVARPAGMPSPSDFALVETVVPEPAPGEVLVRNDWMSVDPSMRGRMRDVPSYLPPFALGAPLEGAAVGTVVKSRSGTLRDGDVVWHHFGWRDYAVVRADETHRLDTTGVRGSDYLGALGMPGLTAYLALSEFAPVHPGDVVFVSAAAGAVGVVAARVARHLGAAAVIGSAGGPEKARRLVEQLGYDRAVDYKSGPIGPALRAAAPGGIDVYLDSVGGDQLEAALDALRTGGRVAVCGSVSEANAAGPVPGPANLALITKKRLTLRGLIVLDHLERWPEWIALARGWLTDGSFVPATTVVDGLENAVGALLGMLSGANVGKMLVRLNRAAA
ncbi:NADP-dependent oxidoreductase [Amycolatopsis sp. ATCC 39116]|uniref:NADP-dependent oxidoreductase n=1 Tax=Amycolatopsis sp. (strain ATCC 39116 / 75iv2) TaxID=385957 RepID=UPI0002626CFB|nr:NADP-dependent oxidoreductase [Amycolatopsis sp. ATCC 39116]